MEESGCWSECRRRASKAPDSSKPSKAAGAPWDVTPWHWAPMPAAAPATVDATVDATVEERLYPLPRAGVMEVRFQLPLDADECESPSFTDAHLHAVIGMVLSAPDPALFTAEAPRRPASRPTAHRSTKTRHKSKTAAGLGPAVPSHVPIYSSSCAAPPSDMETCELLCASLLTGHYIFTVAQVRPVCLPPCLTAAVDRRCCI